MTGATAKRYRWSLRRYLAPEQLWLPAPEPSPWLPTADRKPKRHLALVPLTATPPAPPVALAPAVLPTQHQPYLVPPPAPRPTRGPTERQRKCNPNRRARTIPATGHVTSTRLKVLDAHPRPTTRGDCLPGGTNEARPCPYSACKHHLALEINEENGSLKVIFPTEDGAIDWAAMPQTCSLDVADMVYATGEGKELELEQIGRLMNRSRERIFQLSNKGLQELRAAERRRGG